MRRIILGLFDDETTLPEALRDESLFRSVLAVYLCQAVLPVLFPTITTAIRKNKNNVCLWSGLCAHNVTDGVLLSLLNSRVHSVTVR
eukprot:3129127-Pyramimonas_sp.AAC.3